MSLQQATQCRLRTGAAALGSVLLLLLGLMPLAHAATFTVNVDGSASNDPIATANGDCDIDASNGTPDECTLRAAIQVANANMNGASVIDTINFSIPKVTLDVSLDSIAERVVIDGSTQPPRVEIDGDGRSCFQASGNGYPPGGGDVLLPQANNSRFVNLVIHNCGGDAIRLSGHGYAVFNSYLGVLPDGVTASPNNGDGISITAGLSDGGFPPLSDLPLPDTFSDLAAAVTFIAAALPGLAPNGIVSNVISGNNGSGIDIFGEYAAGTIIFDNRVGTDKDALSPVPNGSSNGHGVAIRNDAYANIVGIDNTIAGNNNFGGNGNTNSSGILVNTGDVPFPNFVIGNQIGTSVQSGFSNATLGNANAGVEAGLVGVWRSSNGDPVDNPLGLALVVGPGNVIGFNGNRNGDIVPPAIPSGAFNGSGSAANSFGRGGVVVVNQNSEGVRIFGNAIGIAEDLAGFLDIGNNGDGVNLSGRNHQVGGENFVEGNIISSNDRHGVTLRSPNTFNIRVHGNNIGTLPLTSADAGNTGNGIWISRAGGVSIGVDPVDGESPEEINRIAFNGLHGIQIEPFSSSGTSAWSVAIRQNQIFGVTSGFLGIDLTDVSNGFDPVDESNRDEDARDHSNWRQNTVTLSNPSFSAGSTGVDYELQSAADGSYRVEFFASSDNGLGGEIFLDEITIATDAAGQASGTFTTSAGDTRGLMLTATVTDIAATDPMAGEPDPPGASGPGPANNTSEFSEPVRVPDTIAFVTATLPVNEGDGSAGLMLRREGAGQDAVTVNLSITDLTTDALDRGAPIPAIVTWPAGDTADKLVSVPIVDDPVFEDSESFELSFSVTSGAAVAATPDIATVTIADNDSPPMISIADAAITESDADQPMVFQLTKTGPTALPAEVSYQFSDGTATTSQDYTAGPDPLSGTVVFAPGSNAETITITVVGDTLYEPPPAETFSVSLSMPDNATIGMGTATGEIIDNDPPPMNGSLQFAMAAVSVGEGAGMATILVTRMGGSDGVVSVDFATMDGTADGSDYTATSGTLSWPDGDSTAQSFTVMITDDATDEPDETINLSLSNPTGGASLGSPDMAVLTITDNDDPPMNGSLQFDMAAVSVGEGAGMATISVTRQGGSTGAVSVDYATSDGTATAGSDYTATSGTLSWPDGDSTAQSFTVMIIDDATDEPDETVNLSLSNPTGGASLGNPATAELTIEDDDIAGIKTFSGKTSTGSGTAVVVFTGGGPSCGFNGSTTLSPPPLPLPAGGYVFPHGVLDSEIDGCTPGANLNFTVTYPQVLPAGTEFWKFGPRPLEPVPSWYQFPATISGDTVTFSITDGGLGDDDLIANGVILDHSGPALISGPIGNGSPVPVPTAGLTGLITLSILLLMLGLITLRPTR